VQFFIGTTNPAKVREIGAILAATGCTFQVTEPVDPDETEDDFLGNALLKARAYAAAAGGTTISEDSGLVVPALNGLPGPWSARFSECRVVDGRVVERTKSGLDREALDRRNYEQVLELMRGIEQPRRAACFVVVLAVAEPDGTVLFHAQGEAHGWLAGEPRGSNGFGYDPIFVGQDTFDKTYAELDGMRKNLRSHRNRVLKEFKAWLGRHLQQAGDAGR